MPGDSKADAHNNFPKYSNSPTLQYKFLPSCNPFLNIFHTTKLDLESNLDFLQGTPLFIIPFQTAAKATQLPSMHIPTPTPFFFLLLPLLVLLSTALSLSLAPPDANANSTLPAPSPLHERQTYTTFSPATPACPPACDYTSSAPGDATNLPAIVTG